jgi:hypothetical protein
LYLNGKNAEYATIDLNIYQNYPIPMLGLVQNESDLKQSAII